MFCAGALREAAYVVCADSVLAPIVPAPILLRRFSPDKVRQSLNRFEVFVPLPLSSRRTLSGEARLCDC